MSSKLNRFRSISIPIFFSGLSLFYLPDVPGGFRIVKWALAGFLLLLVVAVPLLLERIPLRLPEGRVFVAASVGFAVSRGIAVLFHEANARIFWTGTLRYAVGVISFLVFGAVWSSLDGRQRERVVFALLGIAAVASVFLIVSFGDAFDNGVLFEPAIEGTFGNPNWAAGYLLTILPFGVYLIEVKKGMGSKRDALILTALVVVGIAVSLSKTAIVSAVAVSAVIWYVRCDRKALKRRLAGAGAAFALLGILFFHDTLLVWLTPRLFIWKALIATMPGHWWTGNGALQALTRIGDGAAALVDGDVSRYMPKSQIDFVHNDYLQALAEGGVQGGLLFATMVGATLTAAFRSDSRLTRSAGFSFLALSIFALGDSPFYVPVTFFAWWFSAAIVWFSETAAGLRASKAGWATKLSFATAALLLLLEGVRCAAGIRYWSLSEHAASLTVEKRYLRDATLLLAEEGNVLTKYAQASARSRQPAAARAAALQATTVKFDYDDLYIIAQADIDARVADPMLTWHGILEKFPCLHRPRIELAKQHLAAGELDRAGAECNAVLYTACDGANPENQYTRIALRILDSIEKRKRIRGKTDEEQRSE